MYGEHWFTAIWKWCHRFLIGFISGLWLCYSRTFIFLFLSHSSVVWALCFMSLLCWKVNFRRNFSFLAEGSRFLLGFFYILLDPFSLLSWQVPHSLLMRNIPVTWCCHRYASQYGWCSLSDLLCWVCTKCNVFNLGQKVPSWFCQTTKRFATWLQNLQNVFFAYLKRDSRLAFLSNGFLLATLPCRPDLWPLKILLSHAHSDHSLP